MKLTLLSLFWALSFCTILAEEPHVAAPYFGIHLVDEQTGRGVPLIELRTVNDIRCVSDNAGWIAFYEPGLMGREVFFYLSGPGYTKEKDGFGYTGVRVTPQAGETTLVKLKRTNLAERIGRTTGQGQYRDSELLGLPCPLPNLNKGGVMGQDSVQAVPYRGKVFWLWGDTNVPQYPLGNFQTTSAFTPRQVNAENGIAFDYLMDKEKPQQLRHMLPIKEPGAVWLFGLLNVKDDQKKEMLLAHFSRHHALNDAVEHGLCRFNESTGIFEKIMALDASEKWRFPQGNAVRVTDAEGDYFYFCNPLPRVRVKATQHDLLTPASYEALRFDELTHDWSWQHELLPTSQGEEIKLLLNGTIKPEQGQFDLKDGAKGKSVLLHNASITWNAWCQKFVLIGVQNGSKEDPSPLGEVWYAESAKVTGPWRQGVKIASHPRYTFYNPVHHDFLDAEGGKVIYFEGTYSLEFSGNPLAPARYDYNQLMYRLDLSDPALKILRPASPALR